MFVSVIIIKVRKSQKQFYLPSIPKSELRYLPIFNIKALYYIEEVRSSQLSGTNNKVSLFFCILPILEARAWNSQKVSGFLWKDWRHKKLRWDFLTITKDWHALKELTKYDSHDDYCIYYMSIILGLTLAVGVFGIIFWICYLYKYQGRPSVIVISPPDDLRRLSWYSN